MISGIIKAWCRRGVSGRKEGMASSIGGLGFREGFERSWCLNWVPKDRDKFVRHTARKGIPGRGNSPSKIKEVWNSLTNQKTWKFNTETLDARTRGLNLIPQSSGGHWRILSWGMVWPTSHFRLFLDFISLCNLHPQWEALATKRARCPKLAF